MKPDQSLEGKKILTLVEKAEVRKTLKSCLSGCEVTESRSAEEFSNLINEIKFDLAVVSVMKGEGFSLLELTYENAIPVIMLSPQVNDVEHSSISYEKGAAYWIPEEKIHQLTHYLVDFFVAIKRGKDTWAIDSARVGLINGQKRTRLPCHQFIYNYSDDIALTINKFVRMKQVVRSFFPHRHQFYEIIYIEEGEGTHVIDFIPYEIKPGSLFFIAPHQVHFWQINQPFDGYVLTFIEDFLFANSKERSIIQELDFFHDVSGFPFIQLDLATRTIIQKIMEQIQDELNTLAYRSKSMLQIILNMLIIHIQRIVYSNKQMDSHEFLPIVNTFKKLVSENFIETKKVSAYASMLNISESYLFDIIKKSTGFTPGEIIHNEILLEAKRQLAHTDLTIREISFNLRFEDPAYFSRFFKRKADTSPKAFREQIREKYKT